MDNSQAFRPARRQGIILHSGVLFVVTAACGALLMQALAQETRGVFILYLIGCVATFIPIPIILYRLFALLRGLYIIDRDGFHIQWGLRTEDIPMDDFEWVRLPSDLPYDIPKPRLSVPGAILGIQRSEDLGILEYIASDADHLILIACRNRVLVISPRDMEGFQRAFRRYAEMGSISPIKARSSNAEFLASSLLKDRFARSFIFGGIFLSLVLLIAVSFIIPSKANVILGFDPVSATVQEAPSERLLLLPLATIFMLVADIGLGSYLYRKKGFRIASYLALASSLILPVSFILIIVFFVL